MYNRAINSAIFERSTSLEPKLNFYSTYVSARFYTGAAWGVKLNYNTLSEYIV